MKQLLVIFFCYSLLFTYHSFKTYYFCANSILHKALFSHQELTAEMWIYASIFILKYSVIKYTCPRSELNHF